MRPVGRLLLLLTPLLLTGCNERVIEDAIVYLGMWTIFLLVMLVVGIIGLLAVVMVLLAPPFAGLVSGILLRRDASPRRRGFVVAVGLLNLSNFALFVLPCVAMLALAVAPPEPTEPSEPPADVGVSPPEAESSGIKPLAEHPDELMIMTIVLSLLLMLNLAAGIYSLDVGLRRSEELPP